MKRLFTLLMLVCTFMCIPQTMKATNYYVRGAYGTGDWGPYNTGNYMTPSSNSTYTLEYTSTQDGEFRFRFAGSDWNNSEMCPYTSSFDLTTASPSYKIEYYTRNVYGSETIYKDNYFYVTMTKGKTYVFTLAFDGSTPYVSCKVKESTGSDDFKFYVMGGYKDETWSTSDVSRPFVAAGNSKYTYTFTDIEKTFYFRVRGVNPNGSAFDKQLAPNSSSKDIALTTTQQDVVYKDPNGEDMYTSKAWTLTPESGKKYTVWLDYSNSNSPKIWYEEGSTAAAKDFKLLNNADESVLGTSTNGLYTLDLSEETTDKVVKLNVDGADWKLASATTAVTSGTEKYAFNVSGVYPLTFKAGYKYTLKLTDDGTLAVTATAAAQTRKLTAGFYLVGNFFDTDKVNINYDNAVFKFKQIDDTHYQMDIPASLTAHAQILQVNGQNKMVAVYGPTSNKTINCSTPAKNGSISGKLDKSENIEEGSLYWDMTTRNISSSEYTDGMYEIVITTDAKGITATDWKITHDATRRVAYYLSTAAYATAMPIYDRLRANRNNPLQDARFQDYFRSTIHMGENDKYYVASNILMKKDNVGCANEYGAIDISSVEAITPTANKLFLQGNKGKTFDEEKKVYPGEKPFETGTYAGMHEAIYKPAQGNDEVAKSEGHYGIGAEIYISKGDADINAVSMVGDAINGTTTSTEWDWKSTVADMPYDDTEHCYKLTISTTSDNLNKPFRFVGNHTKNINWYEDDIKAVYPYDNKTEGTTAATIADPNVVLKTSNADNSEEAEYHINWNRPQGTWTVRFYITAIADESGNNAVYTYKYTITANNVLELRDYKNVSYKGNARNITNIGDYQYFRSWSDDKAWKTPEGVDVFVVDKYTPADVENGTAASFHLTQIDKDDTYGLKGIIPANIGVILAAKPTLEGAYVNQTTPTGYNVMRITMEEADGETLDQSKLKNLLTPMIYAANIPTKDATGYNYLFGFYRASKVQEGASANEFWVGFYISDGTTKNYPNCSYLNIPEEQVKNLGVGTSWNGLKPGSSEAKQTPALLFDFANIDNNTTAIKNVESTAVVNNGKYYTLSGVMVDKPLAKGIYIHNGKKFIVR